MLTLLTSLLLALPVDSLGGRPDHVNNALSPQFPAVFNQDGGSCGSASRISYMFTHELNALRGADASLPENIYPSHFTWLLTNSHSGKEGMAMANGVPSSVVYGGKTYSHDFGNQDCSAQEFGWMQGYDKWYAAMQNRIERNSFSPYSVNTEKGREYVKHWIWNHWGDTDFTVGGIAGIGVASACKQGDIPDDSLGVNRAAGVVGMKYVTRWGDGVDHALTIVGYDDRILFDLDGNGIAGERDKDERGAWIIVNSWGDGWANGGFIYCPYKYGYPVRQQEGGAWKPEFYHARKNYRPLRTLKVTMNYSRRSELKLRVGIATDTAATRPDTLIDMEHFKYAGDGRGRKQKMGLEAATPMLGRWADGRLHDEPMEMGYDLTDLSATFDTRRPLKYFFVIESLKDAIGHGRLREASIIDYEFDPLGVETPFPLGRGMKIANAGDSTVVATVVVGEPLTAPRHVSREADGTLCWQAPRTTHYERRGYVVFRDGIAADTLGADALRYTTAPTDSAAFTLGTLYAVGDTLMLSARSDRAAQEEKTDNTFASNLRPDARFRLSAPVATAGTRISFLPLDPQEGWRYEWTLKGADRPTAQTINAAATYETAGTYRVRLRVSDAQGRHARTETMRLQVNETTPRADFALSPQVLLRGETLTLTDRSRFAPNRRDWLLESERYALREEGREARVKMEIPGVYDVTLTAANAAGENTLTRKAAVIVCNADSRNGLNFSRPEAAVEIAGSVLPAGTGQMTIGWWMNAAKQRSAAGIGGDKGTWLLEADGKGRLVFTADSLTVRSADGTVLYGTWHHYAVAFDGGAVTFFRDGQPVGDGTLRKGDRTVSHLPTVDTLSLGGSRHPMNAVIDELCLWHKALTADELQQRINAPIADIPTAETTDGLALYYDFNQNGGDVEDRTSAHHNGRRVNFGPDGDAWGLSRGVFSLNFSTPLHDLTTEMLPPSTMPFAAEERTVNSTNEKRFRAFAGDGWIVEKFVENDTIRTGVHVDMNKGGALTVTTGWDGFASALRDHKLYTTVTLPAGRYVLAMKPNGGMSAGTSRLVAARGKGLPDAADMASAIASAPLTDGRLSFVLDRKTDVSLGIVFSLNGHACVPMERITLHRTEMKE